MEKQQQGGGKENQNDQQQNANNAYSGSGTLGNNAESKKLSDYPEGNLDEVKSQTESIPGNQTDQPHGKSVDEATDPSKLSDL